MSIRLRWITLVGAGLVAWPAFAQPPEKPADRPPGGDSAMKQKLIDNFDTNGDGTLDRNEARAIGRALRENFDVGPPGDRGPQGRRRADGPPRDGRGEGRGPEGRRGRGPDDGPADRGPEGRRRGPDGQGPDGRGPGGRGPEGRGPRPDGPPGPPNPERLFNRFDKDEDGSLSLDEFKELTRSMRERMTGRGPMDRPRGPGFERGGPGSPPRGDIDRRGGEGRRWRDRRDGPPSPPPPADPPAAEDVDDPV